MRLAYEEQFTCCQNSPCDGRKWCKHRDPVSEPKDHEARSWNLHTQDSSLDTSLCVPGLRVGHRIGVRHLPPCGACMRNGSALVLPKKCTCFPCLQHMSRAARIRRRRASESRSAYAASKTLSCPCGFDPELSNCGMCARPSRRSARVTPARSGA